MQYLLTQEEYDNLCKQDSIDYETKYKELIHILNRATIHIRSINGIDPFNNDREVSFIIKESNLIPELTNIVNSKRTHL